jgi:hypothetical protein
VCSSEFHESSKNIGGFSSGHWKKFESKSGAWLAEGALGKGALEDCMFDKSPGHEIGCATFTFML